MPQADPADSKARFGSTITVRDSQGIEDTYRIVGVDETDVEKGWISWMSPLARALMNGQPGQEVQVKLPGGTFSVSCLPLRV